MNLGTNGRSYTGPATTIDNGSFSINGVNPLSETLQEGTQKDLATFNMYAASSDQTLQTLQVTADKGGNFAEFADSVAVVDKDGNTVKEITDSTELANTTLNFTDLNMNLEKGMSTKASVRVTLKSGNVTSLGKKIQLSVKPTSVVKTSSSSTSINVANITPFTTKEYTLAAEIPAVKITSKVGTNTSIELQNSSVYDVNVTKIKYRVTRNEGSNNSSYLNWDGTTKFLNAVNGVIAGKFGTNNDQESAAVPGEVTVAPTNLKLQYAPETRVIEVVSDKQTLTERGYTVEITGIEFEYVDRTDATKKSQAIPEKLSVRQ